MFFLNLVCIGVMGFLVWHRGCDQRVGSIRSAHWLRIAAFILLGLQVAIFLVFGIGEMASGGLGGVAHLLPAAAIVLLGILAWMRPLEGGVTLFTAAAIFLVSLLASIPGRGFDAVSPVIMITAVPQIVSGVLFFTAGMLARGKNAPGEIGSDA